jgi:hypothetical protein
MPFLAIESRTKRARLFVTSLIRRKSFAGIGGRVGIEKLRHSYAQSVRNDVNVYQADIALATLDAADVCPIKFARMSERFLRQTFRQPK